MHLPSKMGNEVIEVPYARVLTLKGANVERQTFEISLFHVFRYPFLV